MSLHQKSKPPPIPNLWRFPKVTHKKAFSNSHNDQNDANHANDLLDDGPAVRDNNDKGLCHTAHRNHNDDTPTRTPPHGSVGGVGRRRTGTRSNRHSLPTNDIESQYPSITQTSSFYPFASMMQGTANYIANHLGKTMVGTARCVGQKRRPIGWRYSCQFHCQ